MRRLVSSNILPCILLLAALPLAIATDMTSSGSAMIYYLEKSDGPIASYNSRNDERKELPGSATSARFVGMTVHHKNQRIYWSDHRSIRMSNLDGSEEAIFLGTMIKVTWTGTHFGDSPNDIVSLNVYGEPCLTITYWSSSQVDCILTEPAFVYESEITKDDCIIQTTKGSMQGVTLNYDERVAGGYRSPIVRDISLQVHGLLPHALATPGSASLDPNWLYWTNSADGCIYRNEIDTAALQAVECNAWGVKGLVLATDDNKDTLYFTQETKGKVKSKPVSLIGDSFTTSDATVLVELPSPRGLVIAPSGDTLYVTSKLGRIYRVEVPIAPNEVATAQQVIRVPPTAGLDGIAVDNKYLYWTETNRNVIATAFIGSYHRKVLVGGSADSYLTWPRSIALLSSDGDTNINDDSVIYSEYTGRISQGVRQHLLINSLSSSSMEILDHDIQQASARTQLTGASQHVHMYALE